MHYDSGGNMKIEIKKRIGFFEADSGLRLRPKAMMNYLQEAAAIHSDKAGYEAQKMMAKGVAWILHRINIHIHRQPAVGDELCIRTWHTGDKGFRAYRDFEILCGSEKLVSANSLWLLIDLNHKKILRIPKDTGECYTVEKGHALNMDIDSWKPVLDFEPDLVQAVKTRPSDYDPLGHVNNALYFDYLEILLAHFFSTSRQIRRIIIQFTKEIPREILELQVGIRQQKDRYVFKLFSNECVHAAGKFQLFSDPAI